jgi:hypothetical protein
MINVHHAVRLLAHPDSLGLSYYAQNIMKSFLKTQSIVLRIQGYR